MMSLKASRTPSNIDEISRVFSGVDDDIDVPDWDWCFYDVMNGLHLP